MQKKRTIALIDGFNFYHAVVNHLKKTDENLKWLNYRSLVEDLTPSEDILDQIQFFTAISCHLGKDKEIRHWRYIKALKTVDIRIIQGNFKEKHFKLTISNEKNLKKKKLPWLKMWKLGHEEKETDVNIALTLLDGAYQDEYDKCLLFSADSDLVPAIQLVKKRFPHKQIVLVVPPGTRNITKLKSLCDGEPYYLRPEHFRKHQFPPVIKHKGEKIFSPYR